LNLSPCPPIKVLRIITRLNVGGPAIHAILLTGGLNKEPFHPLLLTGQEEAAEGNMLDLATARGVRPLLVPELGREVSPKRDLAALLKLLRFIKKEKPHIVHTHMAKAGTLGRLAAKMAGVPLIFHTYHGHIFHSYFSPIKTQAFLGIERMLARVTDTIIVVGERQRHEIAAYGIAPITKIVAIPLGLELEPFLVAEGHRGELRQELGLGAETPLVGIVARLVPIKAHEYFLQAARLVREAVGGAKFLVVGDGERRGELERLAQGLGLQGEVLFLGWRRDLPRVYADLDVVVLSSLNEGSPVSLIEALAAARPVVATDVGGVGEVVVDGETGRRVPPKDAAALAQAILTLLADPQRGQRLGLAGRQRVYPQNATQRLVCDIEKLYQSRLAAKGVLS